MQFLDLFWERRRALRLCTYSETDLCNLLVCRCTAVCSERNADRSVRFSGSRMAQAKANGADYGAILLRNQFKGMRLFGPSLLRQIHDVRLLSTELTKHPVDGFSVGLVDDSNIYEWKVMIEGTPGTL